MFACAVTKPAIERPTALGALRHRAPARNVSLILIPWWTWSFTSSLLHLVTWWVLWDWRGLRTGRSTGASWWLDHQGCGHVHTRSGRIFLPGWQRIHPVVSEVAGDQRVSYGWHCLQALWQVFQIWGWRRRSFTMDDRAPPFSFPTHLGACNVLSFLGQHQCFWVVQCWNSLERWWTLELGKWRFWAVNGPTSSVGSKM